MDKRNIVGDIEFRNNSGNDYYSYTIEDRLIAIHKMQDNKNRAMGYIGVGYNLKRVHKNITNLTIKLGALAGVIILLINLVLVWSTNEIRKVSDSEIAAKLEIETAKRNAEMQQSFLANMSHELRTPLNAIVGFSNLLSKSSLKDKQVLYLDNVLDASSTMQVLINDILDFSKIESGELNFEPESFYFGQLLDRVCSSLEPKINANTYLDFSLNADDDVVVFADYHRLKQVFLNIINNSVKYTEEGTIKIRYSFVDEGSDVKLICAVEDTGIGMTKEVQDEIFTPFKQGHNNHKHIEGTGLGLAITRQLVESMKGEISCTSKLGKGSTFAVNLLLPKGKVSDVKVKANFQEIDIVQGLGKILIAEDNELNQYLIKNLLESWGFTIDVVNNGQEAIDMLAKKKYDVVLMDVQMPILGGVEATKRIRESKSNYRDVPIIALTANAIKGDKIIYLESGMNGYASKPISEDLLATELSKFVELKYGKQQTKVKAAEPVNSVNERKEINLDKLNTIMGGDKDKLSNIVKLFIQSVEEDIETFPQLIQEKNYDMISSNAHKVKPSIDFLCEEEDQKSVRLIEKLTPEKIDEVAIKKIQDFVITMSQYKESARLKLG
ncbi:ATP-binding protein [Flavobacteriales bacterium]|nr:ATP-binding protein [Flavobacteriales bacterium]